MWLDWSFVLVLTILAIAVWAIWRAPLSSALPMMGNVIPPVVIILLFGQFSFGLPVWGSLRSAMLLHHFGFGLLCGFLCLSLYCLIQARRLGSSDASKNSAPLFYRRLWIATKLLPAPAALTILLTGLRLIYDSPAQYSLGSDSGGWVSLLLVTLSYMFWDGIFIYTKNTDHLWHAAEKAKGDPPDLWRKSHIIAHALSFPFVFAVGYSRSTVITNPLAPQFGHAEKWLAERVAGSNVFVALSGGEERSASWAAVLMALVPFVGMLALFGVTFLVRWLARTRPAS